MAAKATSAVSLVRNSRSPVRSTTCTGIAVTNKLSFVQIPVNPKEFEQPKEASQRHSNHAGINCTLLRIACLTVLDLMPFCPARSACLWPVVIASNTKEASFLHASICRLKKHSNSECLCSNGSITLCMLRMFLSADVHQ